MFQTALQCFTEIIKIEDCSSKKGVDSRHTKMANTDANKAGFKKKTP